MKLGKAEAAAIAVTAALLLFAGGYYAGRNARAPEGTVTILTEYQPAAAPSPAESADAPPEDTPDAPPEQEAPPERIDINTADAALLATLPGIGETLAERIVEYRTIVGPFTAVEELTEVEGIGEKKLEGFLDLVYAGGFEQ